MNFYSVLKPAAPKTEARSPLMDDETDIFVEMTGDFLEEDVECHFNWGLELLETEYFDVLRAFEEKLRNKDLIVETPLMHKWVLKLNYGYEMFKVDSKAGVKIVKEAVEEMESTDNEFFVTYKTAFQHVACSLLATMLFKTDRDTDQLHNLILRITHYEKMSNKDKSTVLGLKANVFRWYGTDGTKAAIPIITEASSLCPWEFEWKISRVILLTRMRHFNRPQSVTWADVALPMEILNDLVRSKDVVGDREVTCKYFLAVTHRDLIMGQENVDPKQRQDSTEALKKLCAEIHRTQTTSPQVVSFVAQQLAHDGQLELGIDMIQRALEVFPKHIGLNTTISNLYKMSRKFDKVRDHSKIAMDEGGYGAAWIHFEWAVKARVPFDFEDFFDRMLVQHPTSYKAQIHVGAALFYYFHRRNVLRGSDHIKSALEADETYAGMRNSFCTWTRSRVNPLEIAYNQIHTYKTNKQISYRDQKILKEVGDKISSCVDVTKFTTSKDLVKNMLKEARLSSEEWYRKKSTASSAGDP